MGKINQKQNGNGVTAGSGRSYLCLGELRGGPRKKKKEKARKKRKLSIFPKFGLLFLPCRGLVDVDSADELCEQPQHLEGTQIQCLTSDMERTQDVDVMADGEEHGQRR